MPLEEYKCLGPYGADFGEKTGGGGNSWHPGLKGHRVRGNVLSYFLLEILKESITTLLNDLQNLTPDEIIINSTAYLRENQMQEPPLAPIACDPRICNSEAACFTEYEPRVSHPLRDIIVGRGSSNWTLEISFFDSKAILKAESRGRGYLDKKYVYMSHSDSHPLSLLVKPNRTSSVWLCQLQKGFLQYPSTLGDLDNASLLYLDQSIDANATALREYRPPELSEFIYNKFLPYLVLFN